MSETYSSVYSNVCSVLSGYSMHRVVKEKKRDEGDSVTEREVCVS